MTSYMAEGKVSPKGTACESAPNGWHMTTVERVCIHCSKAL